LLVGDDQFHLHLAHVLFYFSNSDGIMTLESSSSSLLLRAIVVVIRDTAETSVNLLKLIVFEEVIIMLVA